MGIFNHMNTNTEVETLRDISFFIAAHYKKSKDSTRLFMNDSSSYQIIPYKILLTEITCYFTDLKNVDFNITLIINAIGVKKIKQIINSKANARRQNFQVNIQLEKNDILWIEIYKKSTNTPISQNDGIFCIVFSN